MEVYSIDPNDSNSNRSYSYLRCNLNSMKDNGIPVSKIARVRLKFYYSGTVPGSLSQFVVPTFDVRILDGSPAWDESTITWNNNLLGLGTSVGTFTPGLYTQAQIDVTSQVKNRLTAADPKSVTFAIDEPASTKNLSFFGSREGVSSPEAMPYLEFEYVPDQPISYAPEIDTYLRGGSFAEQTYGTQTTMTMKDAFQNEFERDVFLQFKVANLAGRTSVRQATLQLYVTNREQNATIPFTVRGEWNVYDATYWEPRLNWAKYRSNPTNPPWRVTGTATQNGIVELDVTDWLNDRLSQSKSVFSFMIIGTASNGQPINRGLDFATKENADLAKRPQLIIVP
ncbi:MAG: DNRLRE domain-containing protein [Fibrella sp.]|nr:DNRLRE domain-containing protein [Armatimonadota bacterium]